MSFRVPVYQLDASKRYAGPFSFNTSRRSLAASSPAARRDTVDARSSA